MLFSLDWLAEYVVLPAEAGELARRLTGAGFAVERLERGMAGAVELLDIDITTNRPDCMCHLGLAREVAVLFDVPLRAPGSAGGGSKAGSDRGATGGSSGSAVAQDRVSAPPTAVIADPEGCVRYAARMVRGVKVGPSPAWLSRRLEAIGVRPISNVVDATNYVLWEMGQPIHAYDLARLAGGPIQVRPARAGECLVTLDGVARELTPEMAVIADARRPLGLAGVMGGQESEVTASTTGVLLEAAHFDPRAVRRTARGAGLHTDASHRFERGADPEICLAAATRAAELVAELAGGTLEERVIDVRARELPVRRGRLSFARLDAFAGAALPRRESLHWLAGLGFGLTPVPAAPGEGERESGSQGEEEGASRGGDESATGTPPGARGTAEVWEVSVPSWRFYDFVPRPGGVVYESDLFEEVLRIHGLDKIPAALPALAGSDGPRGPALAGRERVRDVLAAAGFAEAIHYAFQDAADDAAFPSLRPGTEPLPLANPLSERWAVMRRSLVPNLVASARFNQRHGAESVRLFEVATVFYSRSGEAAGPVALPDQPEHVGLVCGGRLGSPWERETELDFFDLKGVVEGLGCELGVQLTARPAELPGLLPGSTAELVAGSGEVAGFLGQVAGEGGGYPLFVAELAMAPLLAECTVLRVVPPSRQPRILADLTLTHALRVSWSEISSAILAAAVPQLVSFGLKGRYLGPEVPQGAVNTTIAFVYNAPERSLTQEEVNERQLLLAAELDRRFGWKP